MKQMSSKLCGTSSSSQKQSNFILSQIFTSINYKLYEAYSIPIDEGLSAFSITFISKCKTLLVSNDNCKRFVAKFVKSTLFVAFVFFNINYRPHPKDGGR